MNTVRMKAVKRDMNVLGRGLRNSSRHLMSWINEPSDKDIVKRRLLIAAGVPAGFIFIGSQYPVVAVTSGIVLFFGAVFWFARVQEQRMTITEEDFDGPYHYQGRVLDFEELLRSLTLAHPEASLEDLAEHIYEDFEGPDLSGEELAAQMRLYGIRHASFSGPSPTVPNGPVSSGKEAGQDRVEASPEGAEKVRGSGKAQRLVMSLASAAQRYAGSSTESKEKTHDEREERREEQGDGGLDKAEGRPEDPGPDAGEGVGGGTPVRGPEAGQDERGGLPDPDRRHPEDSPQVAEGISAERR